MKMTDKQKRCLESKRSLHCHVERRFLLEFAAHHGAERGGATGYELKQRRHPEKLQEKPAKRSLPIPHGIQQSTYELVGDE